MARIESIGPRLILPMPGETAAPEIAMSDGSVTSLSRRLPSRLKYSSVDIQPISSEPTSSLETVKDTERRPGGAMSRSETFAAQHMTSSGCAAALCPGGPRVP